MTTRYPSPYLRIRLTPSRRVKRRLRGKTIYEKV